MADRRRTPRSRPRRTRECGDDGQAIAELVIVAPILLIVIVFMVAFGRIDSAQGDVESAARAGVQAAVVQSSAAEAEIQATDAVESTLAGAGVTCPSPQVTTNTSHFVAGGSVSVTVTCVTSLADVSVPGLPGSKTLSATSAAPIDPYRVISSGFDTSVQIGAPAALGVPVEVLASFSSSGGDR